MIDSLTVSVLLFVAFAIGAVVLWDALRAWRLRRLAVRDELAARRSSAPLDASPVAASPADASRSGSGSRSEPSLGLGEPPVAGELRPEPALFGGDPPSGVSDRGSDGSLQGVEPEQGSGLSRLGAAFSRPASDESVRPDPPVAPPVRDQMPMPFQYVDSRSIASSGERSVAEPDPGRADTHVSADLLEHRRNPLMQTDSSAPGGADPRASVRSSEAVAPSLSSTPASLPAAAIPAVAAPLSAISDRTDCIGLLRFVQAVPAERLVSLGQLLRRSGSKPVMVEILGAQAATEGWHAPRAGEDCQAARFGLLLANRAGPLNALEYTDFAQRIREMAATLGVGVEIADMATTLARARALDAEGARLDAQVCVNVDATETLSPAQLSSLSGPLAVVERGNNRYARLGPRGETLFSVSLGEQANRLSFLLDVPRVDPASRPFAAMIECVRISARRLPGRIIDDSGKALSERSIEAIASEIDQRCAALAAAGLSAGSAAALRVFN